MKNGTVKTICSFVRRGCRERGQGIGVMPLTGLGEREKL